MEVDFVCDECENENKEGEVMEEGVLGKKKDHFFAECEFCGHLQDVTEEVESNTEEAYEEDVFEEEEVS